VAIIAVTVVVLIVAAASVQNFGTSQNFGFLVRHVDSAAAFFGLGIGIPLVAFALLMVYLRRRHVV